MAVLATSNSLAAPLLPRPLHPCHHTSPDNRHIHKAKQLPPTLLHNNNLQLPSKMVLFHLLDSQDLPRPPKAALSAPLLRLWNPLNVPWTIYACLDRTQRLQHLTTVAVEDAVAETGTSRRRPT